MSDYKDKDVKCPFYITQDCKKIHCEGFLNNSYLHIAFEIKMSKDVFMEKYCNSLPSYLKCPLYPVIAKRFEEEEC